MPDADVSSFEPLDARAYHRQAIAHALQGRLDEAVTSFQQALWLQPDYPDAHNNLGNVFFFQGRYELAEASYRQALALEPDFAEAHNNLGNTLVCQGRYEEARARCQQALDLQPNYPAAQNNLGNALKGLGQLAEAVACYQHALRLQPDYAEAHNNLGLALAGLERLEEAAASYQEALRLKPDYAEAHYNLGLVLVHREEWDLALGRLQEAIRLRPNSAEAHYSLGLAYTELGKPEEADRCYQQALRVRPDYVDAHWGRAHTLLLLGNFALGWPEYEWRWLLKEFTQRPFRQPLWEGGSLAGRTILLHAEQGLGDTLHFIRYVAEVKKHGGTVLVECQPALLPLLSHCPGIDRLVAAGSNLPPFDVQAPLLSLPHILRTALDSVPAAVPYLFADVLLYEQWREELSRLPGFKIGIAWRGGIQYSKDHHRSIPLVQFAPLAQVEGVHLFSLQKGSGSEPIHAVAERFAVTDLGSRLDEQAGAFMDTAAVMRHLDLVITADTAIAHLAGGLGVPVWLALSFVPDWRWLLEREDSPWYPTMRLFRQNQSGDWDGVFERMARELRAQLGTKGSGIRDQALRTQDWTDP
jgi:tetratricopeptide (TPR) repeat protein